MQPTYRDSGRHAQDFEEGSCWQIVLRRFGLTGSSYDGQAWDLEHYPHVICKIMYVIYIHRVYAAVVS